MKPIKNITRRALLVLSMVAVTGTSAQAQRPSRTQNLFERLENIERFSTLVTAIEAAGLEETVAGLEEATIFAPTNAAFDAVPEEALTALLADPVALTNVLTYHVVPEKISFYRLRSGPLTTVQGNDVEITRERYRYWSWHRTRVKVNDSNIVWRNIRATNGIIHGIDSVLDPAFEPPQSLLDIAAGNDDLSILAELVQEAGLARALDSDRLELTVFAPTNAAFEALPAETLEAVRADRHLLRSILKNHIVRGAVKSDDLTTGTVRTIGRTLLNVVVSEDGITVEEADVVLPDVMASNGVAHVVNQVLMPEELKTLIGVVDERDDLSTFKVALEAAGYVHFFEYARYWKFTFFAPNNAAFEAIPPDVLASLLEDKRALRKVLNRHIAFGETLSSDLEDGGKVRTIGGAKLDVAISSEEGATLNGVTIAEADLRASNGVVHVINGVLPEEADTGDEDDEEEDDE